MFRVRVGEGLSDKFEVKVAVHHTSVFSPLLFIIVLVKGGLSWSTLGGPLCRWPCHYCRLHGRMCPYTADLGGGGYGEEGAESEHGA